MAGYYHFDEFGGSFCYDLNPYYLSTPDSSTPYPSATSVPTGTYASHWDRGTPQYRYGPQYSEPFFPSERRRGGLIKKILRWFEDKFRDLVD